MFQASQTTARTDALDVYDAARIRAVCGANAGDTLGCAADVMLDDVYVVLPDAALQQLCLQPTADGMQQVAPDSPTGTPRATVFLDCTLSLMGFDGRVTDAIVLVEVSDDYFVSRTYLLPLAPLLPRTEYRLIHVDTENATRKFARLTCVSFAQGTRITLGSGKQCAVEELQVGDAVLTRDDGVQQIHWIGQITQRAVGSFAPVHISAGTLNNARDLVVSPDHCLYLHRRSDRLAAGSADLMAIARDLVNNSTITRLEGGYVDYFQILFETHQIIYAEGIAADSTLVDDRTAPMLSREMRVEVAAPSRYRRRLGGNHLHRRLLQRPLAVDMLSHAARG